MSLINEALKQAQREAQGGDAPAVRDADVAEAVAGGGRRYRMWAMILVAAVAAGAAGVWWSGRSVEAPDAKRTAVAPPSVAPAPATTTSSSSVTTAPAGAVVTPDVPAEPVAPVAPPPPPPPPAPVVPEKNAQLVEMVSLMRLTLVKRTTGRAVIDGVVVKVGDKLSEEPLLILDAVTDSGVVFKDAAGLVYEKRLK